MRSDSLARRLVSALSVLAAVLIAGHAHATDNWPQFRGPGANPAIADNPNLPETWSTTENVEWVADVTGLGWSSPIVWGDKVFVTTAVGKSGTAPELTKGWEAAAGKSANDTGGWTWGVLCLDRRTGKKLWHADVHEGVPKFKRHPKASPANCTPATDGRHVVAFFGSEGLFCYDMDGRLIWKKDLGDLNASPKGNPDLQWGFASSPIIHGDLVIVQCDCDNVNFWAAFDIKTGREVRRVERDEVSTWSTPSVFVAGGRTQLVLNGYKHMGAYDLYTGEELWKLSGGGDVPVPTPLFADGRIFLTSAHGGRRPIYAILPDARGDLTPTSDAKPAGLAWTHNKVGSYMPTPIVYEHNLYICNDTGILTVLDARTGERRYRKRMGGGANYTASAVAAGGKLYFTDEDGVVRVLKAGNEYKLLASNELGEICMATPAIADGTLFFRTQHHLIAVGK